MAYVIEGRGIWIHDFGEGASSWILGRFDIWEAIPCLHRIFFPSLFCFTGVARCPYSNESKRWDVTYLSIAALLWTYICYSSLRERDYSPLKPLSTPQTLSYHRI